MPASPSWDGGPAARPSTARSTPDSRAWPPRVAALRRSSREIVEGGRPSVRAIARTPSPCPRSSAMSSRSANDRYRPDSGVSWIDGMPPRSRNQRTPTGPDTPHAIAASSLDSPSAIFTQNPRSTSRRTGGRPGDRIAGRPVSVTIHPGRLPIQHLRREVLRRPVEFTQYLSIRYTERLAEAGIELVGREHRRFLRQRAGRDGDRVVQDRGDLPARPLEGPRGRRVRDPRVGRVVQQAAACSNRSATCRRPSSSRPIMTVRPLQPAWRFSRNERSGEPGAVQPSTLWNRTRKLGIRRPTG